MNTAVFSGKRTSDIISSSRYLLDDYSFRDLGIIDISSLIRVVDLASRSLFGWPIFGEVVFIAV